MIIDELIYNIDRLIVIVQILFDVVFNLFDELLSDVQLDILQCTDLNNVIQNMRVLDS